MADLFYDEMDLYPFLRSQIFTGNFLKENRVLHWPKAFMDESVLFSGSLPIRDDSVKLVPDIDNGYQYMVICDPSVSNNWVIASFVEKQRKDYRSWKQNELSKFIYKFDIQGLNGTERLNLYGCGPMVPAWTVNLSPNVSSNMLDVVDKGYYGPSFDNKYHIVNIYGPFSESDIFKVPSYKYVKSHGLIKKNEGD